MKMNENDYITRLTETNNIKKSTPPFLAQAEVRLNVINSNQLESSLNLAWSFIAQYLIDHQSGINQIMVSIAPGYIYTNFDSFSMRIDHSLSEPSLGQERVGRFLISLTF